MAERFLAVLGPDWRRGLAGLTRSHWRAVLALVVLCLAFHLPGLMSLQPMDRDEPRFAQASKQMLETGDFVDIRFQGEARHKKPVGIYWLQTAAVTLGEKLGVPEARRTIGLYRIPSLLGAMALVLLTYWAALAFLSRPGALVAAIMMAASILLGVEARLAKTDAVLGALAVAVLGFLARAYFHARSPQTTPALERRHLVIFWGVIGASVLIKGPIVPLVAAIALVVLALRDRGMGWVKSLRPGMGLLIVLLIVLPWLALILHKTGGSFLEDSVGKDMLAKVGGAQEKHGAPPGTYFGVVWITFWPVAPLLVLAAGFAWRERRDDGVAFLLAWAVPFWLILEAVPTKLPHYVLPVLPALAILTMLAFEREGEAKSRALRWLAAGLMALVPLAFLVAVPGLFLILEEGQMLLRLPFLALPFLLLAVAFGLYAATRIARGEPVRGFLMGAAAALALTIAAYPFGLPMLKAFNLSPRLADAARAAGCADARFATVGYREPSLVFLTETGLLMGTGAEAAAFMDAPGTGCRVAFVERAHEGEFRDSLKGQSAPALVTRVRGVNLNAALDKQRRLRILDMAVYVRR